MPITSKNNEELPEDPEGASVVVFVVVVVWVQARFLLLVRKTSNIYTPPIVFLEPLSNLFYMSQTISSIFVGKNILACF